MPRCGITILVALSITLANVGAARESVPHRQWQRIVGGSPVSILEHPYSVSMLFGTSVNVFVHWCGGALLTSTAILSAAHCFYGSGQTHDPSWWRVRVGSTYHASGGTVYPISRITNHPQFNYYTADNDLSVLRTSTGVVFGDTAQPVAIAGVNYVLPDNAPVWAIGWGYTMNPNESSEFLRHVQIWTVNQEVCRARYGSGIITDAMLCAGWLDVGGRDQCAGDSGGPLLHLGVVVGVCSWGNGCADPYFPGVNARVSIASNWIVLTAQS